MKNDESSLPAQAGIPEELDDYDKKMLEMGWVRCEAPKSLAFEDENVKCYQMTDEMAHKVNERLGELTENAFAEFDEATRRSWILSHKLILGSAEVAI
ncbi:MAG TPA: hypothetical protein P5096_03480 [Patescibacteria group bacterium]|nr:hypothetical protein [Patescibacteria group bacterium]